MIVCFNLSPLSQNAHDDFYEGLAGIGALLGIGIFLAAWLTGLTGLGCAGLIGRCLGGGVFRSKP